MKTIVIGDIHGRNIWKDILSNEIFNKVIFMADYFDTHENISAAEQIHNFKNICELKEELKENMILLIGNHDHHYFSSIGDSGTSGFQRNAAPAITQTLEENKHLLQMAYKMDNILFTHAGVSKTFLHDSGWDEKQDICEFINDLWQFKPKIFMFNGFNPYGDDVTQTPIWIRPKSLMRDSKDLGLIQVVGHTSMKCIDIKGKSTGGKYYFIDTLGTSKEYLIIDDDGQLEFTCKIVNFNK